VLDEDDEYLLDRFALPGVAGNDRRSRVEVQGNADVFWPLGVGGLELVNSDQEGSAALFKVVDGGEAVRQPAGVGQDYCANGAVGQLIPFGGENWVAFSTSSASRWMTSLTAGPATASADSATTSTRT
jgi:hypothetical protein